jgi:hypothetical protein
MIFEYHCGKHGDFEIYLFHGASTPRVFPCPVCNKDAKRKFTAPNIRTCHGKDDVIGEYGSLRERLEKCRFLGVRPIPDRKGDIGSLTKIPIRHCLQEERRDKLGSGKEEGI